MNTKHYGRFVKLARTVAANAASYRSLAACNMALGRLNAEFRRSGSYGCVYHDLQAAKAAIQDRWIYLNCLAEGRTW